MFARQGHRVLAIDGDSNPNLGITLGLPAYEVDEMRDLPTHLLRDVVDEQGNRTRVLTASVEEIAENYGITAADKVRLLAMKRIDHKSKG